MAEFAGKADRVRTLCRKLKPILGVQADQIFSAFLVEDKDGKEQIEGYLEALWAHEAGLQNLEETALLIPPSAEQAYGSYELGTVLYGDRRVGPFGLREGEWIQHIGVFGRTGAGKTNVGYLILKQLKRHEKPFLVFDWKRNYRDLLVLPEFHDVEVYTIGRSVAPFNFNPLIPPPGTPPKTWLKKIIEVIAHAYMLGNGVLYLLQQSVDAVYEKFGVYSGEVTRYPTIRDVLDTAKAHDAKGREAGWLSSTLRALSSLCFGDMDTLINEGENQNLDDLLTKPVILELDALTQSDKIFFIQALLLWVHHRRMVQGEREHFRHAVIIEEAHHVLSGERRSLIGGQSIMEITFREIREFGEGLVILDQHPSEISLPALGNTYTTICLNLKHSRDVSAMGQAMLLDGDEKDILGNLEVGKAVVKLQGRATHPFLIEIPEFHLQKGMVTDEEVARRMAHRFPTPLEPPTTIMAPVPTQEFQPAGEQPPTFQPENVPEPAHYERAPSLDMSFLLDVKENPDSGVANRYKRLGVSVRQGQKLKTRLVMDGLITDTLETTQTGSLRVIRLTDQGARHTQTDTQTAS